MTPAWALLTNPVPSQVTARAVALLKILSLGQARVEPCDVECSTIMTGVKTRLLRYTCENHGGGKVGITVYGLV